MSDKIRFEDTSIGKFYTPSEYVRGDTEYYCNIDDRYYSGIPINVAIRHWRTGELILIKENNKDKYFMSWRAPQVLLNRRVTVRVPVYNKFGIDNLNDIMPPGWKAKGYTLDNFDETLLMAYKKLKELFPGVYVNVNSNGDNKHNYCGFRGPDCDVGARRSAHKEWKALDLHHSNTATLAEIRTFCESEMGLKLGILEVEDRVIATTWVHIATREPQDLTKWTDRTKPYIFKDKKR